MDAADRVNSAVERGASLVSGLMQFSRKQPKGKHEDLDLSKVIRDAHDIISKSFDKRIDIRVDISKRLPIMGVQSTLSQVFMNICTNARDAMPAGGELHIEAKKEGDSALVIISDTGSGMDRGTLEQCFDPFFTTKSPDKGTGLGLSTAYGIVKDHDGEIHVFSEPDRGTTFKIYFPLTVSEKSSKEKSAAGFVKGSGQKILIVDDEIEFLQTIEDALKTFGYTVTAVANCKEAIGEYMSWRPDVVLLDRNMPEMDGMTCSKKILEHDPDAKIVIMSGYDEARLEGIDERTAASIMEYLTKPLDMPELNRVLGRLCHPDFKK